MNTFLLNNYNTFKQSGSSSNGQEIDYKNLYHATQELIPEIVFTGVESLDSLLQRELNEDFFNLPFWLRTLIFRLMQLQKPSVDLYERAIADLRCFLPEGDDKLVSLENELVQFRENSRK